MDTMKSGFYGGFSIMLACTCFFLATGNYDMAAKGFIACFCVGLFGMMIGIFSEDKDDEDL